jgi:hypothetical protein
MAGKNLVKIRGVKILRGNLSLRRWQFRMNPKGTFRTLQYLHHMNTTPLRRILTAFKDNFSLRVVNCLVLINAFFNAPLNGQSAELISEVTQRDSITIRSIYNEILASGQCYEQLRSLCKDVGPRLSGSDNAQKAVFWGKSLLESYGADTVFLQEVVVPKWERGCCENAAIHSGDKEVKVNICALGGSVSTQGIVKAQVIEVKQLSELSTLGRGAIEGKIVFFNRALDPLQINTGAAYGGAFDQRSDGASEAARYGAVGTLVRSLTLAEDSYPHTGAMNYADDADRIPAAALSTSDAKILSQMLREDPELRLSMQLNCVRHPDVVSHNVIAELRGWEFPDRYIVVGGHLDSWDKGEGAHDDGAGIVQSIEVLRTFKALGIRPRHTLRVVLFMNEENGNDGGITYAEKAKEGKLHHVAAVESDAGGFTPRGFRIEARDDQAEKFKSWARLFEPYDLHLFQRGYSGVDIRPLKDGIAALFGLSPDSQRYFDFHHSDRDVFENVHKRELELGAGAIAGLIWLIDTYGI